MGRHTVYVFISGMCLTREGNIVAVDKQGCRIKMYTVQGQLIRSFKCQSAGGVAVNSEGHILVSGTTAINIYRRNGELLESIGDKPKCKSTERLPEGVKGDCTSNININLSMVAFGISYLIKFPGQ